MTLHKRSTHGTPSEKQIHYSRVVRKTFLPLLRCKESPSNVIDFSEVLYLLSGQLKEASVWLNKTNSKWKKPVQMIVDKMSRVLELTLENNLANDIEYTKMFLNLLKKPFHFQRQAQQINTYSQQIFYPNVFYDEEKGDTCFTQVLGSYVKNGR